MSSLKVRVAVYLVVALSIAVLLFTWMVVRNNHEQLMRQAERHAAQLSEVVIKSTRFAMLQNRPSHVDKIIGDVGALENIDRVRILSKSGAIIHSSEASEIGDIVDQEAESCLACHMNKMAQNASPMVGRPRYFHEPDGRRMLGSTAVIRNEPTCASGGCHENAGQQAVLGVLDIVYPLDTIDRTLRANTASIVGLSMGFVLLAAGLVSLLVHRVVYVPLRDLKEGAGRLARGDLQHPIPVRSSDEFGELAISFNSMTAALRKSREQLEDYGHTLEEKVAEAIHELHVAQEEAARGEKLASVGLLAAGIAHELNNPLTGVLTFASLVRKQLPDESPEAEDLDLVIQETKRCASIIRRLLDFAREKTPEQKYIDVNRLIEHTVQLAEQAAHLRDIDIMTDLGENLPPVFADESLIEQVVMNMLVNAEHAIGEHGRITVVTRYRPDYKRPGAAGRKEAMLEISVRDTGCGISEQNLRRIFDPFFTTKGVGKGTGLGLSVSHGSIEAHGGLIEVDSVEGEGTEFRIYLPVDNEPTDGPGTDA